MDKLEEFNLVKIPCPGDGSCYFHSILRGFCKGYIDGNEDVRINYVKHLRKKLATILQNGDEYKKLYGGTLEEFGKTINEFSLNNIIKELLSDDYVNNEVYQELISNLFNIDIYIIDLIKKDIYMLACNDKYLYKNRNSIILGYSYSIDNELLNHYDIIGVKNENGIINTFFTPDHNLIIKLNEIKKLKLKLKN